MDYIQHNKVHTYVFLSNFEQNKKKLKPSKL